MAHALLAMTIALALSTTDRTPPTEFRIFRAGETASTKGTVLFDEEAARSVMNEYAAHGIELPIDWDHAMVREDSPVKDRRAAGWFKLAVRDGELWAVEIRWTAEADAALRAGEWRFTSPAFLYDQATGRVLQLVNVAICNLPATRQLDALVAASKDHGATPHSTTNPAHAAKEGQPMSTILLATMAASLGLAASASEAEVLSTTTQRRDDERQLLTLTGAKSPAEALGILTAWKESHGKIAQIEADEAARIEAAKKDKHTALLKQGRESGQIVGATEGYWSTQPVESLEGYLRVASSALPAPRSAAGSNASATAKAWTELSAMEQHRLVNDDPETAKALRAAAKEASLAMAKIKNTDLIDREILETSIRGSVAAGMNCLYGTGAAVVKTTLSAGRGSVGDQVKIPYFGSLGEMEDVAVDGDALTPKAFASTSELATVVHSGIAFEMTAWAQQGVDDPYGELARQAVESLRRRADKALVDAALAADVPMTLTTGATFSYDNFVNAKLLWGDEQDDIAALCVHSKVYGAMLKLKDANLLPLLIDSAKDGGMPRILGVPVIVSDKLVPAVTVYTSLLLKKNALAFWMNGDVSLKTDSDILADTDVGAIHVYHAAHKYKRMPGLTKGGVVLLKTTEA